MSRINSGTMVVGLFAILVGLGGAYLVRQQLMTPPAPPAERRPPRPTGIPIAATDLEPGREIKIGDMLIVSMTPEEIRKRKLPADTMGNGRQVAGRIVKNRIKKGQAFVPGDLYPEGTGPSVAERLKPGFRAVTVPITNVGTVARFATPGSVVDVLFRTKPTDEIPEATVLLIDKVEVLAVDTSTVPQSLPPPGRTGENALVTLAVSAKQATALKVAEGRGEFTLAMRSLEDGPEAGDLENGMTLNDLLRVTPNKPQQIEMYLGGSQKTVVFGKNKAPGKIAPAPTMPIAADDTKPVPAGTPVQPAAVTSDK